MSISSPYLVPRKFKIEHSVNEYVYWITWMKTEQGDKWAIEIPGGRNEAYMTTSYGFDWPGKNTALFDTPEEALEWWKGYAAQTRV